MWKLEFIQKIFTFMNEKYGGVPLALMLEWKLMEKIMILNVLFWL